MNTRLVNIHYGEIALKKGNRNYFEEVLKRNIRSKLEFMGVKSIRRLSGRMIVEFERPQPWKSIKEALRFVFGFSNASPVEMTPLSLSDLIKRIIDVQSTLEFDSFAVRTKRANKQFELISPEISRRVGSEIVKASGARVDLDNPDILFKIEVLDREIFFSYDRINGEGGLPVGVSGSVLSLLSGGIDSPVASWMMMKRGLNIDFIHFHSIPFTNEASLEKVEDMAEKLVRWEINGRLYLVPFGQLQKEIVTKVAAKYRVVLYRRFMLRIASRIGERIDAKALVTGESLGQVASQTLMNMASIQSVTDMPVLRPLIGLDKQEIIDLAKKIDTYDLSIKPHQDCCSFLQPPRPVTKSTTKELGNVEKALEVDEMVDRALDGISIVKL